MGIEETKQALSLETNLLVLKLSENCCSDDPGQYCAKSFRLGSN